MKKKLLLVLAIISTNAWGMDPVADPAGSGDTSTMSVKDRMAIMQRKLGGEQQRAEFAQDQIAPNTNKLDLDSNTSFYDKTPNTQTLGSYGRPTPPPIPPKPTFQPKSATVSEVTEPIPQNAVAEQRESQIVLAEQLDGFNKKLTNDEYTGWQNYVHANPDTELADIDGFSELHHDDQARLIEDRNDMNHSFGQWKNVINAKSTDTDINNAGFPEAYATKLKEHRDTDAKAEELKNALATRLSNSSPLEALNEEGVDLQKENQKRKPPKRPPKRPTKQPPGIPKKDIKEDVSVTKLNNFYKNLSIAEKTPANKVLEAIRDASFKTFNHRYTNRPDLNKIMLEETPKVIDTVEKWLDKNQKSNQKESVKDALQVLKDKYNEVDNYTEASGNKLTTSWWNPNSVASFDDKIARAKTSEEVEKILKKLNAYTHTSEKAFGHLERLKREAQERIDTLKREAQDETRKDKVEPEDDEQEPEEYYDDEGDGEERPWFDDEDEPEESESLTDKTIRELNELGDVLPRSVLDAETPEERWQAFTQFKKTLDGGNVEVHLETFMEQIEKQVYKLKDNQEDSEINIKYKEKVDKVNFFYEAAREASLAHGNANPFKDEAAFNTFVDKYNELTGKTNTQAPVPPPKPQPVSEPEPEQTQLTQRQQHIKDTLKKVNKEGKQGLSKKLNTLRWADENNDGSGFDHLKTVHFIPARGDDSAILPDRQGPKEHEQIRLSDLGFRQEQVEQMLPVLTKIDNIKESIRDAYPDTLAVDTSKFKIGAQDTTTQMTPEQRAQRPQFLEDKYQEAKRAVDKWIKENQNATDEQKAVINREVVGLKIDAQRAKWDKHSHTKEVAAPVDEDVASVVEQGGLGLRLPDEQGNDFNPISAETELGDNLGTHTFIKGRTLDYTNYTHVAERPDDDDDDEPQWWDDDYEDPADKTIRTLNEMGDVLPPSVMDAKTSKKRWQAFEKFKKTLSGRDIMKHMGDHIEKMNSHISTLYKNFRESNEFSDETIKRYNEQTGKVNKIEENFLEAAAAASSAHGKINPFDNKNAFNTFVDEHNKLIGKTNTQAPTPPPRLRSVQVSKTVQNQQQDKAPPRPPKTVLGKEYIPESEDEAGEDGYSEDETGQQNQQQDQAPPRSPKTVQNQAPTPPPRVAAQKYTSYVPESDDDETGKDGYGEDKTGQQQRQDPGKRSIFRFRNKNGGRPEVFRGNKPILAPTASEA